MKKELQKHKLMIIPKYGDIQPTSKVFENDKGKIVYYGESNDFPAYITELYNKSSISSTAINAIADAIVGGGLTTEDEDVFKRANREGESWNDIFQKVALDRAIFGGYALEIIWSKDRTKITDIYHIDFSFVRAHKMNERGIVPGYYVSSEFSNKGRLRVPDEDIAYLPRFNKLDRTSPSQIYYFNPYRPGMKYYPLPDYQGGLNIIALDAEIDNFHMNNIKNGLAPSLSITTFTNADAEDRETIERQLRQAYAGSDNAGSLIYMDVANKDEAPVITPIPQNGADGYYTTVNDMVTQKILTSHRIVSPMLLGIKTEGQLGGRAEMLEAQALFLKNVIEPKQSDILTTFEEILATNGYTEPIGVEQTRIFEDGEETDVVTSVDAEIGEDKQLEDNIETTEEITNGEYPTNIGS
ncbi:MAG: putative portal protein [Prokaryotic dsDNA virus sp.]|nr:MAG: putative portal protein [Prokaryotic dsDNA virus sp.]|tara:strand:- start:577 stop:1812 length:1236 start_codon:yes stop_codon:yes gene_type:complete